jgi:hypothetical protein
MADLINLRRERKRRDRQQEAAAAAENRLRFGRNRSEQSLNDAQSGIAARRLDGHRLAPSDPPPVSPSAPVRDDG